MTIEVHRSTSPIGGHGWSATYDKGGMSEDSAWNHNADKAVAIVAARAMRQGESAMVIVRGKASHVITAR